MASPTRSLSFSPDGNRLFYVVGSYGREATVQVWDATPLPDERPDARDDYPEPTRWITLDVERPVLLCRSTAAAPLAWS